MHLFGRANQNKAARAKCLAVSLCLAVSKRAAVVQHQPRALSRHVLALLCFWESPTDAQKNTTQKTHPRITSDSQAVVSYTQSCSSREQQQ